MSTTAFDAQWDPDPNKTQPIPRAVNLLALDLQSRPAEPPPGLRQQVVVLATAMQDLMAAVAGKRGLQPHEASAKAAATAVLANIGWVMSAPPPASGRLIGRLAEVAIEEAKPKTAQAAFELGFRAAEDFHRIAKPL